MTIKIIFERAKSKEGSAGGSKKRVNRGPTLKFYCRKHRKNSIFGESQNIWVNFPDILSLFVAMNMWGTHNPQQQAKRAKQNLIQKGKSAIN